MGTEGQPPLLSSGKSLLPYILDCREQVFKTKTAMQSLGMFSVQEIDQTVKDAFLRPDRDIMAVVSEAIIHSRWSAQWSSLVWLTRALVRCSPGMTWEGSSYELLSVGDSRAVLGRWKWRGAWEAIPLSTDHTCNEPEEVDRLRAEHPSEPGMIENGQLLNSGVTKEFGGLHYVTAEPDITTTQIRPESQDFLITANDGFWTHTSSEQAVDLVGRWLAENKLEPPTLGKTKVDRARVERKMAGIIDTLFSKEPPSDGASPGRERTNMKKANEENFVVGGGNAAAQLVRNAFGGKEEDLLSGTRLSAVDAERENSAFGQDPSPPDEFSHVVFFMVSCWDGEDRYVTRAYVGGHIGLACIYRKGEKAADGG
ncbi:MAG: hypothetical protein LQ348_000131 [Seirophora lacunosa]|nr:MAG: hypothetical protein LQ348_000131 [Seirophora lacunosa]